MQTPATRKALAGEPRAALLAPFRSCSCKHQLGSPLSREGEEAAFWVTQCQGLLTQVARHPGSVLTRPPVPSCPRPFWPEQGTGLLPKRGCRLLPGACQSWKWQPVLGEEKKFPPGERSRVTRAGEWHPEGMPGVGREGGGCHEEAAEDAGSRETGAAPALPKQPLLAGLAERATGRNRVGWRRPRSKSSGMRLGCCKRGVRREAGSQHLPEARSSCIQNKTPLPRHGSSREATGSRELAQGPGHGRRASRPAELNLGPAFPFIPCCYNLHRVSQLGPSFKLQGAFLGRAAAFLSRGPCLARLLPASRCSSAAWKCSRGAPRPLPTYQVFLRAEFPAPLIPAPLLPSSQLRQAGSATRRSAVPHGSPPCPSSPALPLGSQEEGRQLGWTFEGEGWVKMWSKSDSERKSRREIDKALGGSLGTRKALPAGWGKRGGGCAAGLGRVEVFRSSWE